MAVLRVDHPDIRQFITCKTDENQITNFNISVAATDAFMQAVRDDASYDLVAPHTGEVVETVRAREIFDLMVQQAHHNGEPGILFIDAANRSNPVPQLYELEATNPCGEQWLGPYENCCLGSINLAEHTAPGGRVDWEQLRQSVVLSTRFLDDVVTANAYVPAVPQLREAAYRARRIGLGIMGLSDLMYHVRVRYGSAEGQEFAAQLMEFVRFHSMRTSIQLAAERGPFIAITGSLYDPHDLRWAPPTPVAPYQHDFGRPTVAWDEIVEGIQSQGIRNAAQTTIAPTGTIATVAGCEGYGCEPVFALAYYRHVDDRGQDLRLTYTSPLFEQALIEGGLDEDVRARVVTEVVEHGTCQDVVEVPEEIRRVFVVSQDITAEEHVRMQAALQAFVDNSLSKTCNFPESAEPNDVAQAYLLAWETSCKGLTVYVTGSRQKVVLETKATATRKAAPAEPSPTQLQMWYEGKKPRPTRLDGCTYQISTPLGKAFVTVNQNSEGQPFEVFITTAKAGSETAAVSEAIGRLISYVLRITSPVSPRQRLAETVRQLAGIGGGRPMGFGPNRVLSLPDGLARALAEYLGETPEAPPPDVSVEAQAESQVPMAIGDLCPECGTAAVVAEEGCRKCHACGYSEC
jgi:ribonucleoside-diphosphate reductase alpha chain